MNASCIHFSYPVLGLFPLLGLRDGTVDGAQVQGLGPGDIWPVRVSRVHIMALSCGGALLAAISLSYNCLNRMSASFVLYSRSGKALHIKKQYGPIKMASGGESDSAIPGFW